MSSPALARKPEALDIEALRSEFPILGQKVNGKPLVYLDSAATTQKPLAVLETERRYYAELNSNIHRGVHALSQKATDAYESVRGVVKDFIHAKDTKEIIFVRGTTEGINLVAQTFGRSKVGAGDEILVSGLEHHSNLVPWQMLAESQGASIKVIPVLDDGSLDLAALDGLLGPKVKLLAIGHVSNALGTVNPIRLITEKAHAKGIPVVVDGAQAVSHIPVDVQELGCDFYTFSAHKLYGPTGVGVLYGKRELLEAMPPWMGGGDMILSVSYERSTYNELPHKFEAGTPNIAGVIGLGAAIRYVQGLGLDRIAAYEHELLVYGTDVLSKLPGLRLIGTAKDKAAILSFVLEGIHPHDIGTILDGDGVAIRTGHHCAQPLMNRFGVPATARASLGVYNTPAELDALAQGLRRVQELLG